MQKPYYGWLSHNCNISVFENFYGDGVHPILVVPKRLSDFDICKAQLIKGNAHAYIYNGLIVLHADTVSAGRCLSLFNADYGHGAKDLWYMLVPFTSDKDNRIYYWAYPEQTWIDCIISPLPVKFDNV
jgi:hypothetical protein